MRLFRWIVGRQRGRGVIGGDDEFEFPVVGTLRHQAVLEGICNGRAREGVHRFCAALLTPQPTNPHDRHAVVVTIQGREVGHLSREDASDFLRALRQGGYADAACEALIVGGWDRGRGDQGNFGVRLNACLPFRLYSAKEWRRRRGEPSEGTIG